MQKSNHYSIIANLLRYPKEDILHHAETVLKMVNSKFPDLSEKMQAFVSEIEKLSTKEQQEYFLKTFDVRAICYLDIGYVMFGEDYKRAQLLVNLQKEHKIAAVDCGFELADHLPNVLTLLSKTTNDSFAAELGFIITAPSIKFMLTRFTNTSNYYKELLEVLLHMLETEFKGEGLDDYAFAEESFAEKNEFLMPSPKMTVCNSNCKPKRF